MKTYTQWSITLLDLRYRKSNNSGTASFTGIACIAKPWTVKGWCSVFLFVCHSDLNLLPVTGNCSTFHQPALCYRKQQTRDHNTNKMDTRRRSSPWYNNQYKMTLHFQCSFCLFIPVSSLWHLIFLHSWHFLHSPRTCSPPYLTCRTWRPTSWGRTISRNVPSWWSSSSQWATLVGPMQ